MPRFFLLSAFSLSAALLPVFTSNTSAAVLFSDNYEGDAIGSTLTADTGSYDADDSNGRVIAFGAAATLPTPAAPNNVFPAAPTGGGLQGLRLQPTSGGGRVAGVLSSAASLSGSTFHFEFDLYASSSISFGFGSQLIGENGVTAGLVSPGSARPKQSFSVNLAAGALTVTRDTDNNATTANAASSTGLTYTTNTWQHYAIDYVIGTGQVTITAGSQTPYVVQNNVTTPYPAFLSAADSDYDSSNGLTPTQVNSLTRVDTIFFATGSSGAVGFVDNVNVTGSVAAVPEPTTLGLLGITGLLAVRRARQMRT